MNKLVTRVLLCTSPLQVINARATMLYNNSPNVDYKDYVFIIHPIVIENSKNMIKKYSNKLNYEDTIDFTSLLQNSPHYVRDQMLLDSVDKAITSREILTGKNKPKSNQQSHINRLLKKFKTKGVSTETTIIQKTIKSNIGTIDEAYMRVNYSGIEQLFIQAFDPQPVYYGLEDGFGDYQQRKHLKYGIYNIKHSIRIVRNKIIMRILHYCFGFKKLYKPSFELTFSNIRINDRVCIKSFFIKTLQKLSNKKSPENIPIVLILGAPLLVYPGKYNMTIEREVEIYNQIIEKIMLEYGISNNLIYYKHHPRLLRSSWEYKKKHLNCNLYDYYFDDITEIEILNKNIAALYSIGSTTLLYAKEYFGIDSYFIDFRSENMHPTHLYETYNVLKNFGIESIEID